jgi:two-component system sensor histidine kinase LytS
MLISELLFVATTYCTIWLYERMFVVKKYSLYFTTGVAMWILYLCVRTVFQFYCLQNEPRFKGNSFTDIFINNITVVVISFLFISACKYFKDGYITQQFEAEKKAQQLQAEVNNLKSQIAPHFLFNTLNNLYGLAVDKSDKLPNLMLRLSDLLRHSLYEAEKPFVLLNEELDVLKSYINLERLRLEDDLVLDFADGVPKRSTCQVAPLILIVFIENAFKHAKLVQPERVAIYIEAELQNDWLNFRVKNNYKKKEEGAKNGIGLANVKRRLELLYPNGQHELAITQDETYFEVFLGMRLKKSLINGIDH